MLIMVVYFLCVFYLCRFVGFESRYQLLRLGCCVGNRV